MVDAERETRLVETGLLGEDSGGNVTKPGKSGKSTRQVAHDTTAYHLTITANTIIAITHRATTNGAKTFTCCSKI